MTGSIIKPLGVHYLAEFHDCDPSVLNSSSAISDMMLESVEISGATMIQPFFHEFSPHGISGIIVVAESHFAIHTWPEHGYAAVDLFSCGEFEYRAALMHIKKILRSGNWSVTKIDRGKLSDTGTEHPSVTAEKIELQQEQ